ncbi:hypothetical protein [Caulobacter sp. FWC2]|uniref:hypothetical protein n=1 Tax=Caulobacter sp. FWC2 TaxID=69664 RepID=UPI000C14792E|nr:hypothetical protein [Caulobacter sp. FWC2]PIB94331.1 hypothetical protein CSW62_23815 [Caulobacter sp. FWC2]
MSDRVDDDTALEEVMGFLDAPPEEGSADDARFGERLRQVIAAAIPLDEGEDPADGPTLQLDDGLRGRLEALAKKRGGSHYFGDHPDGIGPTLGMDVSKS